MFALIERPGTRAHVRVAPATRAVVTWNTGAPAGEIALTVHRTDGSVTAPLPYARWSPAARRSLDGADARTRIAVDVVRSEVPFAGIGVTSSAALDALAVATPWPDDAPAPPGPRRTPTLAVPERSQYARGYERERGWCSAASLAMLLGAWGVHAPVVELARAVHDDAYGGTGNWAFNAAEAARRGMFAAVAYLRGVEHAARFVAAGYPVALSIAWRAGALRGAPIDHSDGHLIVLRGLENGTAIVNDPAQPGVLVRYDRAALDRVHRAHGGVAYLVAPRVHAAALAALAAAPDA